MTREEAIEALNEIFDDSEFSRYESWYGTAMDMAIEALSADAVHKPDYSYEADMVRRLKEALSAEAEWIQCSERLPSEKDGRVLVTVHGEVMIAVHSEFSSTWYLGEMFAVGREDPVAWMPLPKPYKGGDDTTGESL